MTVEATAANLSCTCETCEYSVPIEDEYGNPTPWALCYGSIEPEVVDLGHTCDDWEPADGEEARG